MIFCSRDDDDDDDDDGDDDDGKCDDDDCNCDDGDCNCDDDDCNCDDDDNDCSVLMHNPNNFLLTTATSPLICKFLLNLDGNCVRNFTELLATVSLLATNAIVKKTSQFSKECKGLRTKNDFSLIFSTSAKAKPLSCRKSFSVMR